VEEKINGEVKDVKEELTEAAKIDDFINSSIKEEPKEEEEIELPKVDVKEFAEYAGEIASTVIGIEETKKAEYVKKYVAVNAPILKALRFDKHLAKFQLFLPRPAALIGGVVTLIISAIFLGKRYKKKVQEKEEEVKRKVGDQYIPATGPAHPGERLENHEPRERDVS